ncbi:hypothetical protein Lesp02_66590 [Lentzea sp. NBRC 105346]|uniref:divisome protein SepX/GlpR n=1 Tax=Lentzea sp. NBRC 105346 TaxID=3032205 RepID=UPI0024A03280|nr:gephyrin-like molybdotransferase receptor GlpR [Lentzea sp. NBRC 105346]GLZ34472.1 hypothetical protein Lesp02_66590 [Lentzea sp. NBRC 105346]
MPSSLIIVALVVAWLVVLVPMVARKRQDNARSVEEDYDPMPDAEYEDFEEDFDEFDERPYRPGRGGYDPETAAVIAQARYAFRRRVVAFLLVAALATGLVAGFLYPVVWWGHAAVDVLLVGYLTYLRRQVRIEEEIRARRQARLQQVRRRRPEPEAGVVEEEVAPAPVAPEPVFEEEVASVLPPQPRFEHYVRPGTIPVDADDEDPMFVELDGPEKLPYRGAVGA